MKSRPTPNRAICRGDLARFSGVGSDPTQIAVKVAQWSTEFLEKFLFKCESAQWRTAATAELQKRLLPKTKKVLKKQRNKRLRRHPG